MQVFLNQSGHQENVRAYSQLFRDGRLQCVMSDVGYPVNQHSPSAYVIRYNYDQDGNWHEPR